MATLIAFLTFLGICCWAYTPSRKSRFDADARLPLEDEQ